ncbi:carbohydrate ABC transporter permease [Ruoffia tabacinasalis]|jgi:sn-glycerol 3-phosphate transport system permease protein|uniref:Carbohydrate ABC transporter permease n=1 Tax=Ruoffia tabacinasalis TaxID=87458 RepID=A0ABS0LIC1_9LACT|nr:carbohydrate ABC transporter permease [Ruoffia tabacinasalis]MBG9977958.1 carbohydrate ABC transporter permease [Ruoffia tabacinasalis]
MQAPINATDKRYIRRRKLGRFALIVLNVIAWLIIMFPLIYAFLMAIKPSGELYDPNSVLFPQNPTLSNFVDVFDIAPIGRYIMNSLIVAVSITLLQITTSILAAFAFRFLNFKGKGIIYGLILSTMMIPGEAVIISQFLMVSGWGLTDSITVLIIPFIVSAFNIFLCVQALENFPYEIYESAKIDGCSDFRFAFTMVLPLIKPTIGAMAVQSFLAGWNMYMWPLLVTNDDSNRTVQIGISMLNSVDSQSLVLMVAGIVICMIPSLAIFIVGQRNMIKGLTSGAVKG